MQKSILKVKGPTARKFEEWIKNNCQTLIFLTMVVDPKSDAYLYFNSAIDGGHSMMFMRPSAIPSGIKGFYPPNGVTTTEALKGKFTTDGFILGEDGKNLNVWGANWYFCKPQ